MKSSLNALVLTTMLCLLFCATLLQASSASGSFERRYMSNIIGNLKVIGNTVLYDPKNRASSNADIDLRYANEDGDPHTFNASKATLEDSDIRDETKAKVLWAGLYWQSYLHTWDNYFGGSSSNPYRFTQWTENQIIHTINTHTIKFTLPDGSRHNIAPDEIKLLHNPSISSRNNYRYANISYSCFANVTAYLKNHSPLGEYMVANVPSQEGDTRGYTFNDGLGNYGAWSLVVVYQNDSDPDGIARNISIFDGFEKISKATGGITIPISGFLTPTSGDVDSTMSAFTAEGDKYISGDYLEVINEAGERHKLSPSKNYFNSSISGVDTRSPTYTNNNGIDIHTDQLGTINSGANILKNNHSSVTLSLQTTGDTYFPSMIAFATKLYLPEVCYDYTIRSDNFTIPSTDKKIYLPPHGTLYINPLIRSLEGDFDLLHSTLSIDVTPASQVSFNGEAYYSVTGTNFLQEAILTHPTRPQIAIGKDANTSGGTIARNELYFAKVGYTFNTDDHFSGSFELDLNTTINFGSGAVPIVLSTRNGTLKQCPQSPTYNPIWGSFNIERSNSGSYNPITQKNQRFPLYTQIAGRSFDVSAVAYDETLTTELPLQEAVIEVELIDAVPYDDNRSLFKCNNPDLDIVQGESVMVHFKDTSRVKMEGIDSQKALQNAAFRVWVLTAKQSDAMLMHTCTERDNQACWRELYETHYHDANSTQNVCVRACSHSTTPSSDCYACMKNYYGSAICSRDNFAIRPESYRLVVSDTNESDASNASKRKLSDNTSTHSSIPLAAEYAYRFEANATQYKSDKVANGYYKDATATLSFQGSKTTCNDTNNTHLSYYFRNGSLDRKYLNDLLPSISHYNAGPYDVTLVDEQWTLVDQFSFTYKTYPSHDCIQNSASVSSSGEDLSGCNISSDLDATHTTLKMHFLPYAFNLASLHMVLPNEQGFVYVNTIDTTNLLTLAMSAAFDGNVTAIGRKGTPLTNFVSGCASKPVRYHNTRVMTQNSTPINPYTLTTQGVIPQSVSLQSNYIDRNGLSLVQRESNTTNGSLALTITAEQFTKEAKGAAPLRLYYNFPRIERQPLNPINLLFVTHDANATEALSYAHLTSEYLPTGTAEVNRSVDFLYGRVVPNSSLTYLIAPSNDTTTIDYYAEAYCSGLIQAGTAEMNATLYGLTLSSQREDENGVWWLNNRHNTATDGGINTLTDLQGSSYLSITPRTAIALNNPTSVTVTITPSTTRPYTTLIETQAPVWFSDSTGIYNATVNFQESGGWAGKGKTGHIIDSNASFDNLNKRVDW
jgi:hypothetical protein